MKAFNLKTEFKYFMFSFDKSFHNYLWQQSAEVWGLNCGKGGSLYYREIYWEEIYIYHENDKLARKKSVSIYSQVFITTLSKQLQGGFSQLCGLLLPQRVYRAT